MKRFLDYLGLQNDEEQDQNDDSEGTKYDFERSN